MAAQNLPLIIVQMGRPPQYIREIFGEQGDWMTAAIGPIPAPLVVICPEDGEILPVPSQLSRAVITGSWAMVTDRLVRSERTAEWVRTMVSAGVPLLGVCYGHHFHLLLSDSAFGSVAP